jgi:hypothetical protein
MRTKTNQMKSFFEYALAIVCGIFTWFISGNWLHVNWYNLMMISWYEIFIAGLKLFQTGLAGMIGVVGGLAGKKYFFPYAEKQYKKFFSKKKKQ